MQRQPTTPAASVAHTCPGEQAGPPPQVQVDGSEMSAHALARTQPAGVDTQVAQAMPPSSIPEAQF